MQTAIETVQLNMELLLAKEDEQQTWNAMERAVANLEHAKLEYSRAHSRVAMAECALTAHVDKTRHMGVLSAPSYRRPRRVKSIGSSISARQIKRDAAYLRSDARLNRFGGVDV